MDKWEYKTLSEYTGQFSLTRLGREGWELVGLTSHLDSGMFPIARWEYVLKRKIVE